MDARIPVTVVTGFLGAGKSTLLEGWLAQLPRDTVVIVNEQGVVGIDGELLARRVARIREITGGCVCCVTNAALDAALTEFADSSPTPTRILLETSGAASPAGVIQVLTRGIARDQLSVDGVVTVIDAARARQRLKFGLTIEQLGFADVVVMSHVDLCAEPDLISLESDLAAYAPGAVIARANKGRLSASGAQTLLGLLEARGDVLRILPSAANDAAHRQIQAVSLVHHGELDERQFGDWVESVLGAIEARLLRIKGILAVRGVDTRVIVQGVSEAVEVTMGAPWGREERTSRLVILGLDLDEDTLRAGFASCLADGDA
ncbi:MAG: GTP-binding protein [Nannocystaceae bacterium]